MDCQPDMARLREEWKALLEVLEPEFGEVDLQGILFLVGIQELGQGIRTFSKDEKQDLMHIATCRLMSNYGYYERMGNDNDGWPVWQLKDRPPAMKLKEQDALLKQAAVRYFRELGLIT
jgi:hypothetical protein